MRREREINSLPLKDTQSSRIFENSRQESVVSYVFHEIDWKFNRNHSFRKQNRMSAL